MEVARVQLQLLETISLLPQTQQTTNAIAELHSGLSHFLFVFHLKASSYNDFYIIALFKS